MLLVQEMFENVQETFTAKFKIVSKDWVIGRFVLKLGDTWKNSMRLLVYHITIIPGN